MKRKIFKGVLFFGGLAVATAAMIWFLLDFTSRGSMIPNAYIISIIVATGVIPAGFALMMHARDVRETKRSLSDFCKGLAIFWFVTGGLNLAGSTVLLIIFG